MGIYASLFSASITLAGFIAVFLVFRYRQIDTYVDARKDILISLLKEKIKKDPYIAAIIQDIGKKHETEDVRSFFNCINKRLVPINKELVYLNKQTKEAVTELVNHILAYRRMRDEIVYLGLTSIGFWGGLSLFNLIGYFISPCPFSSISCSNTVTGISIRFFIDSMVLTLCFVFYSLLAKRPEIVMSEE